MSNRLKQNVLDAKVVRGMLIGCGHFVIVSIVRMREMEIWSEWEEQKEKKKELKMRGRN